MFSIQRKKIECCYYIKIVYNWIIETNQGVFQMFNTVIQNMASIENNLNGQTGFSICKTSESNGLIRVIKNFYKNCYIIEYQCPLLNTTSVNDIIHTLFTKHETSMNLLLLFLMNSILPPKICKNIEELISEINEYSHFNFIIIETK